MKPEWVMVPKMPNRAQINAAVPFTLEPPVRTMDLKTGAFSYTGGGASLAPERIAAAYRAMLAAAPSPVFSEEDLERAARAIFEFDRRHIIIAETGELAMEPWDAGPEENRELNRDRLRVALSALNLGPSNG